MSGSDLWVCRYCRSVNAGRSGRCYRCHTPREVAVARPEELSVHHQESRPEATGKFESSESRAVLLTVATAAFLLGSAVAIWISFQIFQLRIAGEAAAADALLAERQALIVDVPVLSAVALLAYASWISRLVANLPALGLGYSRVSPRYAFFEPFIPGRNLYSLPARTAEVVRKLDEQSRDHVLIGLAWTLVVAPLPVVAIASRILLLFGTWRDVLVLGSYGTPIVFAFEAAGLIVALLVVWHVEGLVKARLEASPAGVAAVPR